jgi:AAHS family 4-hydroxybenzoate transporter-like MFS transporter
MPTMTPSPIVNVSSLIDRNRLSRVQVVAIVLCGLIALLDGLDTQAIAFVAPVVAREWGLDVAAFGPVFGSGLLGLMLGALVFGPVADRIGRKRVLIGATLWFGLFALLTGSAGSMTELLIYRFVTGIGLGAAMPNVIALTSEYAPARSRATLVTVMFCGFPLGAVLGGLASAKLIAAFGWPAVFHMGGILPLLLAPALVLWLPESIRFLVQRGDAAARVAAICRRIDGGSYDAAQRFVIEDKKLEGLPVRHLFRERRAWGTVALWLVFFCNLLLIYFLINWLPSVLREAGLSLDKAIIGTVALNAGGIVGGLALGRLIDRRGPFGVLGGAYLVGALFIVLIGALTAGVGALMLVIALTGFCVLGTQFGINALAASYYPTSIRSTGVGWALGIGRIGSIVGPVVGGIVLALDWSIGAIFLIAAIPAVVAAAGVLVLRLQAADAPRPLSAPQPVAAPPVAD